MESSLGELFRRARRANDWTQTELAHRAGVSTRTIDRIENDRGGVDASTLRHVANILEFDLDESQLVNQEGIAATTYQTSNTTSGSSEAVTTTPQETPGAARLPPPIVDGAARVGPSPDAERRPDHRRLIVGLSAIIIVVLVAIGGIVYWALIGKDAYNTISGQVTCPNNQPVVGVYVYPVNGGGNLATLQFLNSSESVARFRYVLPNGGPYNLHGGCGGTSDKWGRAYRTESCSGTIDDRDFHAFICYDQPPADKSKPCLVKYGRQ